MSTKRVRVTRPTRHRTRIQPRPATVEIDEQTRLGEVYMRTLIRTQLRLGLTVALVSLGLLALFPLLLTVVPQIASVRLLGFPMQWVVLGIAVYPALVTVAWVYIRHAERVERDFAELMDNR